MVVQGSKGVRGSSNYQTIQQNEATDKDLSDLSAECTTDAKAGMIVLASNRGLEGNEWQ